MYEFAVCDDDALFTAQFKIQLADILSGKDISYHLTVFSDVPSLLRSIDSGQKYHLIFQDILFESEQGIRFARLLRERKYKTDIIFISTDPYYAIEGYDVFPLHYLLKPIDPAKLDTALNRFLERNAYQSLRFTTPKGVLQIRINEILFFEIYGHEITIHKTDGSEETCIGTLKEVESALPALTFVRPHRSYLVNLDHISEIMRYQIRLSSGAIVPISKNLYKQTQSVFIDYADKKCISL